MAKNKDKKPHNQIQPDNKKQPRIEPRANYSKFTWSYSLLDKDGPFGWSQCESAEKYLEILEKKGELEEKDLTELYYRKCHSVEIWKLCKDAQQRLQELKQDDLDSLFSFRLTGTNRVWCIKHESIMRVLWWDPEHKVCPSEKKHT